MSEKYIFSTFYNYFLWKNKINTVIIDTNSLLLIKQSKIVLYTLGGIIMRKTKIICTLGPSTDDPIIMKKLMKEGMNVARFNFSHGTHQEHLDRLKMVQRCRTELGLWVATMLDTKGPEIRVGLFKDGPIYLNEGDRFTLTTEEIEGTKEKAHVRYKDFPRDVVVGTRVLFDDGLIESIVEEINGEEVVVKIMNGGKLSNNKGINPIGTEVPCSDRVPLRNTRNFDLADHALVHLAVGIGAARGVAKGEAVGAGGELEFQRGGA